MTYHIRAEARLILPLEKLAPVNVGEEVMRLDFCGAIGTQTALGVTVQQAGEKIPSGRGNNVTAGEGQWLLQDLAVHLIDGLIVERRETSQHLVQQNTKSPPVHRLGVPVTKKQFGGKIFRSSAECYNLD